MKVQHIILCACAGIVVTSCQRDAAPEAPQSVTSESIGMLDEESGLGLHGEGAGGGGRGGLARQKNAEAQKAMRPRGDMADMPMPAAAAPPPAEAFAAMDDAGADVIDNKESAPNEAPTRAWFPETFLFAPSVLTKDGKGEVSVRVPDRLTTWRVLALAHSRQGAQAGAVTSFASLLPVSVDVVVPPFLVAGDRASLPIQVQNTTDKALSRALSLKADGATLEGAPTSISVPAQASASLTAALVAKRPGTVAVTAGIGDDTIVRSVDVLPTGLPRQLERSAELASPRTFTFTPSDDDGEPVAGSARVVARVTPGALAILRSELLNAPSRAGLEEDGALLMLSAHAESLAQSLGYSALATDDSAEHKALVTLRRRAAQRLARHALSMNMSTAQALAGGAGLHDPEGLIGRTGEHFLNFLAREQRPDGTWGGGSGMTVQHLLVVTADALLSLQAASNAPHATDAAKRRTEKAQLAARGAFTRMVPQAKDPYTAAAVLMTGAVDDDVKAELIALIVAAATDAGDGSKRIAVDDVVRRDGRSPSAVEVAARAILALKDNDEHKALRADLGAYLLQNYRRSGFGDGLTARHALNATALVFKDPLPAQVAITVSVDGKPTVEQVLTGDKLTDTITLSAPLAALSKKGTTVTITAEPALPGLATSVSLDYAVPVPPPSPQAGMTLSHTAPAKLKVGVPTALAVQALVPGGAPLDVEIALPAGVDVVLASLEALKSNDTINGFEHNEGVVRLRAGSRAQGELFTASFQVVPTLAGTLSERYAFVSALGREVYVPPTLWRIER